LFGVMTDVFPIRGVENAASTHRSHVYLDVECFQDKEK
jgi:hypothetical protein